MAFHAKSVHSFSMLNTWSYFQVTQNSWCLIVWIEIKRVKEIMPVCLAIFSPYTYSEHCEASIKYIHMRFNGTGAKVHAVTLNVTALRISSLGNSAVILQKLKSVRFMAQRWEKSIKTTFQVFTSSYTWDWRFSHCSIDVHCEKLRQF